MKSELSKLCEELKIKADVEYGGEVPEDWTPGTNPWKVTLRFGRRRLTVPFYTGPACEREPTAADVLRCIVSDCQAGEQDFEEYCSEFGQNPDSRKAEQTWKACAKIAPKVRRFLAQHFDDIASAEH